MNKDFVPELDEDVVEEILFKNDEEETDNLFKILADLETECEWLTHEFERLQQEEQSLDKTIEELQKDEKEIQIQELNYWRLYIKYKSELISIEEDYITVHDSILYTCKQLQKLQGQNVFSSTFQIVHSGNIGVINGFKLGHLPSAPVEWEEINSAWGQTALLLYALSNRIDIKFERYCVVPKGNASYIEVVPEKLVLPLHATGKFRFFINKKYDLAMTAFLECIQQFKLALLKGSSNFHLPNKIENDRLKDPITLNYFSVKLQSNTMEHWTKAMKLMLINLKSILEWFSSQMK